MGESDVDALQATTGPDEGERLQCLRSLQVLDTPPDAALDAITAAAASALHCPVALVSLIAEDRQWFKSRHGMEAEQTPRAWAICDHTIRGGGRFVVEDARRDPRFADYPSVSGPPHVVFYAGEPLRVDGHAVGSLCVFDHVPRTLDATQCELLGHLARAVEHMLERGRDMHRLALSQIRLQDFVAASSAFVWECDAELRLTWISPEAASHLKPAARRPGMLLWNAPLRDALGRLGPSSRTLHAALARGERCVNLWLDLPGLRGAATYAISALPVQDGQGRRIGWRGKARDVGGEMQALRLQRVHDERLAGITAHVPGVIYEYRIGPDGRASFPYASEGIRRVYEVAAEDVRDDATPVMARLHPEDIDRVSESIVQSADTLSPWRDEYRVRLPRAGERWLEGHATPQRGEDGSVRWFGFIQDVTDRRRAAVALAEAQQRLRLAMQAGRLGVVRFDTVEGVVVLDRQARADHGLPDDARRLTLAQWQDTVAEAQRALAHDALARAVARPGPVRVQLALACDQRWLELDIERQGEGSTLLGVCRDISAQQLAQYAQQERQQAQMERHQARQEQAMARQEQLLAKKENELAQVRREREREFVSRASHELRTPMNAILGFVQLLQGDSGSPLAPHQREWLQQVQGAGRHLMTLVHDLLDLSQLEQGGREIVLAPLSLAEAVGAVRGMLQALAAEAGVVIAQPVAPDADPLHVLASAQGLHQVLNNLLGNAIKYNRRGGRVELHLRRAEGFAVLDVCDQGPGIAPDRLERLFRPFDRLGAESGSVPGSGLGLAIARRAAEAMGGSIEVAHTGASGTCMRLALVASVVGMASAADGDADGHRAAEPAAGPAPGEAVALAAVAAATAAAAVAAARTGPAPRAGPRFEAFGVEDNEVNGLLLQAVFSRWPDWRLTLFERAEPALEALREQRPRLLLTDLQLPGMGGLELTHEVKALHGDAAPHCVVLTADASPETRTAALQAGADDFWEKPLELALLEACLSRLSSV